MLRTLSESLRPMTPLVRSLAGHRPADAREAADLRQIVEFVARHPDPFDRRIREGHLTGSAIVVSTDGGRVLLLRHRKLQRWLQPGGHADPGGKGGETVALGEALEGQAFSGFALLPGARRPPDLTVTDIPHPGDPPHPLTSDLPNPCLSPS